MFESHSSVNYKVYRFGDISLSFQHGVLGEIMGIFPHVFPAVFEELSMLIQPPPCLPSRELTENNMKVQGF